MDIIKFFIASFLLSICFFYLSISSKRSKRYDENQSLIYSWTSVILGLQWFYVGIIFLIFPENFPGNQREIFYLTAIIIPWLTILPLFILLMYPVFKKIYKSFNKNSEG
jgi:hypothetical protein